MTGSRKILFLLLSGGVHVLAVALVFWLAQQTGPIYENIEVTSYVTAGSKPQAAKREKQTAPKSAEQKNDQTIDSSAASKMPVQPQTGAVAGTGHEEYSESLAGDSEITTPAVLLTKTKAHRTEAARQADYSGIAQVELIVGSDGTVKDAKLRNSLPYGLDEVALKIARDSKFKPAMINSKPVASAILFKVRFETEK